MLKSGAWSEPSGRTFAIAGIGDSDQFIHFQSRFTVLHCTGGVDGVLWRVPQWTGRASMTQPATCRAVI